MNLSDKEESILLNFINEELCDISKKDAFEIINIVAKNNTRKEFILNILNLTQQDANDTKINKDLSDDLKIAIDFNRFKNKNLTIYCDGSCSGNPGPIGSGIIVYHNNKILASIIGGYEKISTNNVAELKALTVALEIANISKSAKIYSDSKYSIDSITVWANNWKKNGWRKSGNKEIKNLDIIKRGNELFTNINDKVEINYVKGHSGDKGNDKADNLANLARKKTQLIFIKK